MAQDLKNKYIAVVGVSASQEKYGYRIFKDLLGAGYHADGVNPKGGRILGKEIYRNLKELKEKPDIVVTVVPPSVTEQVVDDCRALGIRELWMQPGSESEAAVRKAKDNGIAVTRNACIMVMNELW